MRSVAARSGGHYNDHTAKMNQITFITSYRNDPSPHRGRNQIPIIDAFRSREWAVVEISHESLHAENGRVFGHEEKDDGTVERRVDICHSKLIWIFGFGPKETFLDRMQLLKALPPEKFVNTVDAFVFRHGKHGILFSKVRFPQPRSFVSDQSEILYAQIQEGGNWVIKPSAGSFGMGVCLINKDDPNAKSIIELATQSEHAILQERIDTQHEKRWLVANGLTMGVYAKRLTGHRGNLDAGMQPIAAAQVSREEEDLVSQAACDLRHLGIRYAAIDVAFPYVLDVNFVNPGWLATYEELTGKNLAFNVADTFSD